MKNKLKNQVVEERCQNLVVKKSFSFSKTT